MYGESFWVQNWALTFKPEGADERASFDCLDVVNVSEQGLVERKDTFVDMAQLQAALPALDVAAELGDSPGAGGSHGWWNDGTDGTGRPPLPAASFGLPSRRSAAKKRGGSGLNRGLFRRPLDHFSRDLLGQLARVLRLGVVGGSERRDQGLDEGLSTLR